MPFITGLEVIYGYDTPPPTGYFKIPADLNKGAGGEYIYLCYTTADNAEGPITGIQVLAAKRADPVIQSGYTKIPKDLNKGSFGRYIYVCYTKDKGLPPIAEVNVIQGSWPEVHPPSVEWIRDNQDCCQGNRGEFTYITYRRENVETEYQRRESERVAEAERKLAEAEHRASEAEMRVREAELRAREAETRAGES